VTAADGESFAVGTRSAAARATASYLSASSCDLFGAGAEQNFEDAGGVLRPPESIDYVTSLSHRRQGLVVLPERVPAPKDSPSARSPA